MNFDRLIEISRALKGKNQTGKSFHTTFILRKRKILSIGINNYNSTHPRTKNYPSRYKGTGYIAGVHSEISSLIKLGYMNDYSNLTLVNIRIGNDGLIRNSAPCLGCSQVLSGCNFKRIYYTTESGLWVSKRG